MTKKKTKMKKGSIEDRLERVEGSLDYILNKVSANGRPGLENSLKDILAEVRSYKTKVEEILDVTKTSRAWRDVRKSVGVLVKESPLIAVLRNKVVRVLLLVFLVLLLNSLLHAIGVVFDFQSVLRFLRIIP